MKIVLDANVIVTMGDHHLRREDATGGIAGLLFGAVLGDTVNVRSCTPLPESEESLIDLDWVQQIVALQQKIRPKDSVVGWYVTGPELDDNVHSFMVEEFRSLTNPVLLFLDSKLPIESSVSAFSCVSIAGQEKTGFVFKQVPFSIANHPAQKPVVNHMIKAKASGASIVKDVSESTKEVLAQMTKDLEILEDYVKRVIEGKIPANENIGRYIHETLVPLKKLELTDQRKLDLATVISKITQAQLRNSNNAILL